MKRRDAEGAEGLRVWSDADDTAQLHIVSASRRGSVVSSGLSALSATAWESFRASLRFIMSVLNG